MTALRWFLSYLLPMLILSGIAVAYYYRVQLSSDWYRTLSWPVTQINTVLQHQKLQVNVIKPALSTEMLTNKSIVVIHSNDTQSEYDSLATMSDAQESSKTKAKISVKATSDEKPLTHTTKSTEMTSPDIKDSPLITQQETKLATLPKTNDNVTSTLISKKPISVDCLVLASQSQQRVKPPVMGTMAPRLVSKPPTQFKLNKKQLILLYQARKAYWVNDLKNAKKHYMTLITQLSDNPDIHGELGNLFYREHKLELAIKHYAIAAKLLIKHRHYWKLTSIMQLVLRFNPEKVNEIMEVMHNQNKISTGNNLKGK